VELGLVEVCREWIARPAAAGRSLNLELLAAAARLVDIGCSFIVVEAAACAVIAGLWGALVVLLAGVLAPKEPDEAGTRVGAGASVSISGGGAGSTGCGAREFWRATPTVLARWEIVATVVGQSAAELATGVE